MGVDFIKIRVDDNLGTAEKMKAEIYQAVIARAHEKGFKVASHLFYLDDAKGLLKAGTDFVGHSIRDQAIDDEVMGLFKERNVCYCPTLTREVSAFVYEDVPEFFEDPFFLKEADPAVLATLQEPERMQKMKESSAAQAYKKALEQAKANLKNVNPASPSPSEPTRPAARFKDMSGGLSDGGRRAHPRADPPLRDGGRGALPRSRRAGHSREGQVGRLHRPQRRSARRHRQDAGHRLRLDLGEPRPSGRERVAGLYLSRAAFLFQLDEAGEERPLREVVDLWIDVGIDPPEQFFHRLRLAPERPQDLLLSLLAVLQGLLDDGAAVGHRWSMAGIERSPGHGLEEAKRLEVGGEVSVRRIHEDRR
jgi:hypothetical protein